MGERASRGRTQQLTQEVRLPSLQEKVNEAPSVVECTKTIEYPESANLEFVNTIKPKLDNTMIS